MAETGSGDSRAIRLSLGPYEVAVATTFGPRVVGFKRDPGPEMFVDLDPEVSADHPSGAKYRFRGWHPVLGHRFASKPGAETTHAEAWEIKPCPDLESAAAAVTT